MKFSHKFLLAQIVIFGISVVAIFHAFQNTRSIGVEYTQVVDETLPLLQSLDELRFAAVRIASSTSEYSLITSLTDPLMGGEVKSDAHRKKHERSLVKEESEIERGGDTLLEGLKIYDSLVQSELSRAWAQGDLQQKGWKLIVAGAALRDGLERAAPSPELLELRAMVDRAESDILATIAEQIKIQKQKLQLRRDQVHETISSAQKALVISAILALLAACLVNVFGWRMIVTPLTHLTTAANRLAKGDFTSIPENRSFDEIGTLTAAFSYMARELRDLMCRNQQAVDAAHASQARFRDVAEASSDWIWETDAEHRLTFLSDRFTEVTGHPVEPLLGQPLLAFLSPGPVTERPAEHQLRLADKQPFRDICYRFQDHDGQPHVCRLAGKPIMAQGDVFRGYRGTAADITAEIEARARAQHLALHDALTGLPNRVLFAERFDYTLSSMRRRKSMVAVLCLDLDHFKDINDTLGHGVGDALLKEVANRLRGLVRETDTVARLGGDEFVIIQADVNDRADTELLCQRLTETLASVYDLEGHDVHTSASIGVALAPEDGHDHDRLLKNADLALYRAKEHGRGIYRFFEEEMSVTLEQRKTLESHLRSALAEEQFELCYQPQFGLDNVEVTGVEALIRWNHPERGVISPMDFIPLAEETGLIIPITEWVLRRAFTEARDWHDLSVAINLSPAAFKHQDLLGLIESTLRDTDFDPRRLELEITETSLLQDCERAVVILNDLKAMGIKIVMDDFGTGYSSLRYLQQFPFDKIKIDRSFVSELTADEDSMSIVRAVINLGQSLGMATNAEGVETIDQALFLTGQGCDEVQGFYYARPMPATEIATIVRAGRDGVLNRKAS